MSETLYDVINRAAEEFNLNPSNRIFSIDSKIIEKFQRDLERCGFVRDDEIHVGVGLSDAEPSRLTYENIGRLKFEIDYRKIVEGKEVLVLPAELVGGKSGEYALLTRKNS